MQSLEMVITVNVGFVFSPRFKNRLKLNNMQQGILLACMGVTVLVFIVKLSFPYLHHLPCC